MQQLNFSYNVNDIQRLYVEKSLESLYKGTLDSYRVRINNTKSILEEVINVTQQVKDGVLQRNEYVKETCTEAKNLISKFPDSLIWNNISKDFYLSKILTSHSNKSNFLKIIQASKLALSDNQEYAIRIIENIEEIINGYIEGDDVLENSILLKYSDFYNIELLEKGYSKQYLYQFFRTIFVHTGDNTLNFNSRFQLWKNLFSNIERQYQVIFKIISNKFQYAELQRINSAYEKVNRVYRAKLPNTTSNEIKNFLEQNKREKLVAIAVNSTDHYKSIEIAKSILHRDLDLYHSGFSGIKNIIDKQVGVFINSNPEKASTEPSNYQIDGFTRGNRSILNSLMVKIEALDRTIVSEESINKLMSGFRYLRMGTESSSLESKLLNYWIGLEYIFTSHKDDLRTIDRIRDYYPICHSVIYVKRKLFAFHKAILRLGIHTSIADYNDDLQYLNQNATYEDVIANSPNLLMKIRSKNLQIWTSDPSSIKQSLHNHQTNLKWNISRLYRIRNEIVHNAALKNNIQSNVSHIRYYLNFTLYSILNFLSDTPIDITNDGKISIEDFFVTQEIKLANMNGKTISEYNNITNPMEMFY